MKICRIKKKLPCCVLLCAAALVLAVSGCSGNTQSVASTASAAASPTPQSTPWIFGEAADNGDNEINSEVLKELKTRVYGFSKAPTILIYHTHATEAYLQYGNYTYVESDSYKTEDNEKNIVYLGEVLKSELETLGFKVIHDTTNVEYPEISSAYGRSLEIMKKYEGVDIYLDLHRNAADVAKTKNNTALVEGKNCAKMFFVVGTGVGTYEGEYDVAPDWKANYTLARSVQDAVLKQAAGIMKAIRTKVGRYNQHMGMCLLAEVGNNANTMEEALHAVPYLADALGEVLKF